MAMLTAANIANMMAAVSQGNIEFEEWVKRHKIPEALKNESKELWDELVEYQKNLPPGGVMSPPGEWT